jgi:hypothetical protein
VTTITVTIDDGESEPRTVELPAHWVICGVCDGDGKTSAGLGSFTQEDFEEDPDFAEEYMAGGYDVQCPCCRGRGSVKEIDRDRCTTEEQKAALKHLDDKAEWQREAFRERKMESLMLGESTLRDWDGVTPPYPNYH